LKKEDFFGRFAEAMGSVEPFLYKQDALEMSRFEQGGLVSGCSCTQGGKKDCGKNARIWQ